MGLGVSRGVLPRHRAQEPLSGLSLGSSPELCFAFVLLQFPDETLRSSELLNMIVAVIDSFQVRRGPALGCQAAPPSPPPLPGGSDPKGQAGSARLLQVSLPPSLGFAEP